MDNRRLVCLVFMLILGACSPPASDDDPLPPSPESTATFIPTSTSPPSLPRASYPPPAAASPESLVSPTARRQEPIIIFRQEGGFAGAMLQWLIYEDGRVIAEGSGPGAVSGQYQVDPGAVSELMATLEDTGYFRERPVKGNPVCCDFFTFTLTVRRDDQEITFSYSDGDQSAPEFLRMATAAVQAFQEEVTATGNGSQ